MPRIARSSLVLIACWWGAWIEAAVTPAQEAQDAIGEVLAAIDTAVRESDLEAALEHYDPEDESLRSGARIELGNLLAHEGLEYQRRVGGIRVEEDVATATVLESTSYTEHGRDQNEVGWQTVRLVRRQGAWKVGAVEDLDGIRTEHTDLTLTLEPEAGRMQGRARLDLEVIEDGQDNLLFSLNRGLAIEAITGPEGEPLDFERNALTVVVPWPAPLTKGRKLSVTIDFAGSFFNEFEAYGYSLVHLGPEGCFANFVTSWYPRVNGRLSKSSARISYTAPAPLTVASVGRLVAREKAGDLATTVYEVETPMDFTFNANRFRHRAREVDGIQIGVYLLSGDQEKADWYAERVAAVVAFGKELYGLLPFAGYRISEVPPETVGGLGGSGGQGLNFYPVGALAEESFNLPLIAHESGHMWWGSWVLSEHGTMIDEGMAQLNAVLAVRHFEGEPAMWRFVQEGTVDYPQSARMYFKEFGDGHDDLPLGVHDEARKAPLNRLAYVKAHVVYTMLMEKVGFETFVRGLRRIVAEYGNRLFDLPDLQRIMEEESGQDLNAFFAQWFHRTGAPELALESTVKPGGNGFVVEGRITQLREPYALDVEVAVEGPDSRTVETVAVAGPETSFTIPVSREPTKVILDPEGKLLRWTDEFETLTRLGTASRLVRGGQAEQALDVLTGFVELQPENLEGRFLLAMALRTLGRDDEARAQLEALTAGVEPGGFRMSQWPVPLALLELAQLLSAVGDADAARRQFERVLEFPSVDGTHQRATAGLSGLAENPPD
jgi:aminopeptidase N